MAYERDKNREDIKEEIREKSDIVDVIGSYISLKRKNNDYWACCPFHGEKTPSFHVDPAKQSYYCFGCREHGDVFSFIMKQENVSFGESMKILADRAGIQLPEYRPRTKEEEERYERKKRLYSIYKDAANWFYLMLKSEEGRRAMTYLREKRRLTEETIRTFALGFAPQGRNRLARFLESRGYTASEIEESGLVRFEKGATDFFWNRVMFPITDTENRPIAFGGRVMGDGNPKYINSAEYTLFNKKKCLYALYLARKTKEDHFLLCEGYLDVITLHQNGFTNAVASLGTAFTEDHAKIIKKYVDKVVLSFDSDGAGRKAAIAAIPVLEKAGLMVRVANLTPYKDPDEFLLHESAEELKKRYENAENSFLYIVRMESAGKDLTDPSVKARHFLYVAKLLCRKTDEVERGYIADSIEKIYGHNAKALLRKSSDFIYNGEETFGYGEVAPEEERKVPQNSASSARPKDVPERYILTYLAEHPEHTADLREVLPPSCLNNDLSGEIIRKFYLAAEEGEVRPRSILFPYMDGEKTSEVTELIFRPSMEMDDASLRKAVRDSILKIRTDYVLLRMEEAKKDGRVDLKRTQELIEERKQLKNLKFPRNLCD